MKAKKKPYVPYEVGLYERLRDPEYAAGYLNAVLHDPEAKLSTFLLAVAHVARAHGMTEIAQKAHLHRVGLHKMLRKSGNPELRSVLRVFKAVNLGLQVDTKPLALIA